LRIGAVLPHTYLFGGVRRYIELSNAFSTRGHEFIIYTPDGVSPAWTGMSVKCMRLAEAGDRDHDVVMTGSPEYLEILKGFPARLRVFYLQIEKVDREREIARTEGVALMANSKGMMERMRKKYGVRTLDGRGGINPALFHPPAEVRATDSGPLRVMCYGRTSRPRKGTRFVIKAAESLYRKGYDIELVLFDSMTPGSTDPRVGFDPGLPFRFYIDLPQDRMAAMYASADVFVSAEHRAGWSNTCAEAAACALPLVCTESGTSDFAVDGLSAIVIKARSPAAIGRALERLYRDREMALRMGAEGARRILDFTWEKVCDRMSGQFAAVLGGEERTPG
jgi:glycosyltransferase involved in cell wall biosynthesis